MDLRKLEKRLKIMKSSAAYLPMNVSDWNDIYDALLLAVRREIREGEDKGFIDDINRALQEYSAGKCKTFNSIEELMADLETEDGRCDSAVDSKSCIPEQGIKDSE